MSINKTKFTFLLLFILVNCELPSIYTSLNFFTRAPHSIYDFFNALKNFKNEIFKISIYVIFHFKYISTYVCMCMSIMFRNFKIKSFTCNLQQIDH